MPPECQAGRAQYSEGTRTTDLGRTQVFFRNRFRIEVNALAPNDAGPRKWAVLRQKIPPGKKASAVFPHGREQMLRQDPEHPRLTGGGISAW